MDNKNEYSEVIHSVLGFRICLQDKTAVGNQSENSKVTVNETATQFQELILQHGNNTVTTRLDSSEARVYKLVCPVTDEGGLILWLSEIHVREELKNSTHLSTKFLSFKINSGLLAKDRDK